MLQILVTLMVKKAKCALFGHDRPLVTTLDCLTPPWLITCPRCGRHRTAMVLSPSTIDGRRW